MAINTPLTRTNFLGNCTSGLPTGNPGTDTQANSVLARSVRVSAASSANIMLPGDASNIDVKLYVTTGSAGANAEVRFGNTADATHYAAFTQVSAAGIYRNPQSVSAQSLLTITGQDTLMIVRGSAINNFEGVAVVTFNRTA